MSIKINNSFELNVLVLEQGDDFYMHYGIWPGDIMTSFKIRKSFSHQNFILEKQMWVDEVDHLLQKRTWLQENRFKHSNILFKASFNTSYSHLPDCLRQEFKQAFTEADRCLTPWALSLLEFNDAETKLCSLDQIKHAFHEEEDWIYQNVIGSSQCPSINDAL